jgi:hypothetical protein
MAEKKHIVRADEHHLAALLHDFVNYYSTNFDYHGDILLEHLRMIVSILNAEGGFITDCKRSDDGWENVIVKVFSKDDNENYHENIKKGEKVQFSEDFLVDIDKDGYEHKHCNDDSIAVSKSTINFKKVVKQPHKLRENHYLIFYIYGVGIETICNYVIKFVGSLLTYQNRSIYHFNSLYKKLNDSYSIESRNATLEATESLLRYSSKLEVETDPIIANYLDVCLSLALKPSRFQASLKDSPHQQIKRQLRKLGTWVSMRISKLEGFSYIHKGDFPARLDDLTGLEDMTLTRLAMTRILLHMFHKGLYPDMDGGGTAENKNRQWEQKAKDWVHDKIRSLNKEADGIKEDARLRTAWLWVFVSCQLFKEDRLHIKCKEVLDYIRDDLKEITFDYLIRHIGDDKNFGSSPRITSDWLWSWYLTRILKQTRIDERILESGSFHGTHHHYNETIRMEWARNLSILVLSQLRWCRNLIFQRRDEIEGRDVFRKIEKFKEVSSEEELMAKIGLVEEYAYTVYGLDRDMRFKEKLFSLFPFEVVLYLMKPAFRDHLFHVLQVYLLGELLLESILPLKNTPGESDRLWKEWTKPINEKHKGLRELEARGLLGKNWVFAALFHDIGFIYDAIRQVITQTASPQSQELKNAFEELKFALFTIDEDFHKSDEFKELKSETDASDILPEHMDHGVFGAIEGKALHNKLFKNVNEHNDLSWAIKAIYKHNLGGVTIDYNNEPLSFLLFLCDHLQEWDRPRGDRAKMAQEFVFSLYRIGDEHPSGESCLEYLMTNAKTIMDKDGYLSLKFEDRHLCFFLHFKDASTGQVEPVCYWGKTTLDAAGLVIPPKTEIHFQVLAYHPYSHFLQTCRKYDTEIDIFQDAIEGRYLGAGISRWVNHLRAINVKLANKKSLKKFNPSDAITINEFMNVLQAENDAIAYASFPEKGECYYIDLNEMKEAPNIPTGWPEDTFRLIAVKKLS